MTLPSQSRYAARRLGLGAAASRGLEISGERSEAVSALWGPSLTARNPTWEAMNSITPVSHWLCIDVGAGCSSATGITRHHVRRTALRGDGRQRLIAGLGSRGGRFGHSQ